ncbi:hypothetical protein E2C01_012328 [Portunus trituberculatus]|uniref:Uncharacterized protein n=1 Tax=Portunus trituberculatus TaxID=210409 RepID=A0A5B7DDT0_PORTR|nr:hypothetical protein [Portunus trituberculatus]
MKTHLSVLHLTLQSTPVLHSPLSSVTFILDPHPEPPTPHLPCAQAAATRRFTPSLVGPENIHLKQFPPFSSILRPFSPANVSKKPRRPDPAHQVNDPDEP